MTGLESYTNKNFAQIPFIIFDGSSIMETPIKKKKKPIKNNPKISNPFPSAPPTPPNPQTHQEHRFDHNRGIKRSQRHVR